jgi:hypothetical protein
MIHPAPEWKPAIESANKVEETPEAVSKVIADFDNPTYEEDIKNPYVMRF